MNFEQAREVFHADHGSLLAIIDQLQLPHTSVCLSVKLSLQLQQAGRFVFVDFVYVISEAASVMYGGF
jgi:hypothetical protein